MIFTPCTLAGAFIVDVDPRHDERGFFARSYCDEQFRAQGIEAPIRECSLSFNARLGTLRGMHYQASPHAEDKLVRCTAGAIFDVIVDMRPQSATHRRWFGTELSARNRRALFAPRGFAHGFISLSDGAEVFYMISAAHAPQFSRGFKWNDPAVAIEWPLRPAVISARDDGYPPLPAP
ncbi:MAG TPA: dTDP-4-dehydrorhamnose 3,5-epimerase [Steroidobacteraceae bacterium]|nr:dTDP-4-dehydrorhamnose 3,5-epimerase [Steroidobacteraceae bacterium]